MPTKRTITVTSNGEIFLRRGKNPRVPYEHQRQAMACLDQMDRNPQFSTMVVLPTGGGKTYTASTWLLRHAIDRRHKILWLAHRQVLLDQAAESFQKYAYAEQAPHRTSFRYRIVSGSTNHDRTIDIRPDDDLLILSKDSVGRNLKCLDGWLRREKELYLVVDEAHHSTAKTYRRIIEYVRKKVAHVKLLGLTATPFRTAESEQGLLSKLYTDGIQGGKVVHNGIGIAYQISLKELIARRILAKPEFKSCRTQESFGDGLDERALREIQMQDRLPEDIVRRITDSAPRNRLIVDTYLAGREMYGPTLVFALNIEHAIALKAVFQKSGVPADFVVSTLRDQATGASVSRAENERKLEQFRTGKLKVLINVNILTEGVDLPQTRSVFLARPTVSTILMTQMVGRALRGPAAGGTETAYIVSFIDDWEQHIAWVNPQSLFCDMESDFADTQTDRAQRDLRLISVAKIEEFARMADSAIDTRLLERVPFVERIPIGMYAFRYRSAGESEVEHTCQVMVYNSTEKAYQNLMEDLEDLFYIFDASEEETLPEELLLKMERHCRDTYFCGEMIPPYDRKDVLDILRYYAQSGVAPTFYTFEEIDRNRLDLGRIARYIWNQDMTQQQAKTYIESLWESGDDNMLRLFFGEKRHFIRQLSIEQEKLLFPDLQEEEPRIRYGTKNLEDLPLYEIRKIDPKLEEELRDGAFAKVQTDYGTYICPHCGMERAKRTYFQVDHIKPLSQGGKSVPDNLQVLCTVCNARKGDH